MTRSLPKLHAVTNNSILELPDYLDRASALALGRYVALHIRCAGCTGKRLTELVEQTTTACAGTDATILVNDRAYVARLTGAAGVHLPAAGLPVAAARALLGSDALIGRSTHSAAEAQGAAAEGADYVFLGPIWHTRSHPEREPIGLDPISAVKGIPVFAIGGVTPERVRLALEAGAHGVAAISSLWSAADPRAAAESMLLSFDI